MYPELKKFIREAVKSQKPDESRMKEIRTAAEQISRYINQKPLPSLIFVCTHNSRRSQFSQIWAEVMQHYHGLEEEFYVQSAGTETTACNPRTVASLERAGFEIASRDIAENPVYHCRYDENAEPVRLWSKTLDDEVVKRPLIAVMTCSHADANCPLVPGALERVKLMYEDPKLSDDTSAEEQTYDERSMQIAAELHELFRLLKQKPD